jgi:hypothetical protein
MGIIIKSHFDTITVIRGICVNDFDECGYVWPMAMHGIIYSSSRGVRYHGL